MGLLDPPSVPSRFNRSGLASALPAASAGLAGVTYRYTDVGSAIYSGRVDQCDGTQWVTIVPPSGTYAPAGTIALTDVSAAVTVGGALVVGKHNPVDATAGNLAMTLADAGGGGRLVSVEKTDASANTVTVTANIRGTPGSTIVLSLSREAVYFASKADGSWWPVAGHKTLASLDGRYERKFPHQILASGKAQVDWQTTPDSSGGVGIVLNRTSDAGYYPTIVAKIDGTAHFGMTGLDYLLPEAILLYDYAIPQTSGTKSGDTLRVAHGAHFNMGDGVGTPPTAHRLTVTSTGATDDPALTGALIKLTRGTGSPVGDYLRGNSDGTDNFNINKNGQAALGGTYSGSWTNGALEVATGASIKGASIAPTLQLIRSGDVAKSWITDIDSAGGLRIRDNSRGVNLLTASTAGALVLGQTGGGAAITTTGGQSLDDGSGAMTVKLTLGVNGGGLTIGDANGTSTYGPFVQFNRSNTVTKSFLIGVTSSGQGVFRDNTVGRNGFTMDTNGGVALGDNANTIAANATGGFVGIRRVIAGSLPTGLPNSMGAGVVPVTLADDGAGNYYLMAYIGSAWKKVALT